MGIDLSRFKVVHGDKVFNAIALMDVHMPENVEWVRMSECFILT